MWYAIGALITLVVIGITVGVFSDELFYEDSQHTKERVFQSERVLVYGFH